ncbi:MULTISPECIES: DUF4088 family protein [Cupriavidus]
MTTEISLALPDDAAAKLRAEFEHFVKLSTGLDSEFTPPDFDDFLRARLLHHDGPLTERAVTRLLSGGEYAWAKRVFNKQLPNAMATLMRDAQRFGYGLAVRYEWTPQERLAHAREWSRQILEDAGTDLAFTEPLASQLASSAVDIRVLEEQMQTPAWRLAESLRSRVYDVMYRVQTERGAGAARARLGELRALLALALEYGTVNAEEAARVMEQVEQTCPHLFREEPDDLFARVAAWLRRALLQ